MNRPMVTACAHIPVLLHEAVDAWRTDPRGCYVDATFGRGGHSRELLRGLDSDARLLAFDRDPAAATEAARWDDPRFAFRHAPFTAIATLARASVAGVLMDLGVSSPQVDTPERGFSFQADGPLDMRMDPTQGQTVAQWLAQASEAEISEVIHDYGEERFARAIAKALVARRLAGQPVERTLELAELVAGAVRTRERGKHPATRTFQAFRIFINGELQELEQALNATLNVLQPGGRLVVISFHSLEDRIVKRFMQRNARVDGSGRLPPPVEPALRLRLIERVRPGDDEVARNPRARSAVMRVAERTACA